MAGTKEGGIKTALKIKERIGNDYYKEIGRNGGRNGHTGGFAANPELAKIAGAKGGRISKRGPAFSRETLETIQNFLLDNPTMTFKEVAKKFGVGVGVVSREAKKLEDKKGEVQ